jgi:hypothetical protein
MEILKIPVLRSPVMVIAFSGWNDAGEAASGAASHLLAVGLTLHLMLFPNSSLKLIRKSSMTFRLIARWSMSMTQAFEISLGLELKSLLWQLHHLTTISSLFAALNHL